MPNWCANNLTIIGSKKNLNIFSSAKEDEKYKGIYGEFEKNDKVELTREERNVLDVAWIKKVGKRLQRLVSLALPSDIITNILLTYITTDAQCISYSFLSRWAPFKGDDIICLSSRHPFLRLHLMYGERGMEFLGEKWVKNGILEKKSYERKLDNRDYIPRKPPKNGDEYTDDEDEKYFRNCFHGPFAQLLELSG
jgi:hypothetical protein